MFSIIAMSIYHYHSAGEWIIANIFFKKALKNKTTIEEIQKYTATNEYSVIHLTGFESNFHWGR